MGLQVHKRRVPVKRRSVGHRRYAKERRHGTLFVATVSSVVILVLVLGAGFAYAWYSGQEPVKLPKVVTEEKKEPTPAAKPKVPKRVSVGVATQLITSPVAPGEEASLSVHTNPLATCSIDVRYDDVPVSSPDLKPQHADEYGVVSWDWIIDESAPIGTWPIEVTCSYKKEWGVVKPDLEISNKKPTTAN